MIWKRLLCPIGVHKLGWVATHEGVFHWCLKCHRQWLSPVVPRPTKVFWWVRRRTPAALAIVVAFVIGRRSRR
jgi:hypothetical protein